MLLNMVMFKVTICDIGKMNINMTDKIEKRRQPLQYRTMAMTTTIMSMVRASAAMTAAWKLRRHELCRELQRITSKRATHTRRCSSTTTQTIWVAVVTSPTLTARWCSILSMCLSVKSLLRNATTFGITPYLFNAKEFDEETGMYYYGARYYEPRLSLWMSTDPMEEKYPDYSTYIYAAQNPIAYSDPTGMEIRGVTKSDAEEFKSDVHLILGDSKFDNLRSLISLKGKKFQQIPDAALADALDGVTCSEDEMAYISLLVNTINSKEVHSIEYLKDGEEVSSSGYSDINKYLNSIDPDSKIGDAFRKREERSDGSTRYYYDDATIQTLGGEGFNVPTSKGSHSFIRGVQDKLKAVTSAHELLGHGLPSARKESPVHNNTNAIRTDNLVRRLLRLPQRDGSDHAGGKDIVSPYSLPYTK